MFAPSPFEKVPPCQCGCPNGNDVRGWIAEIAQRHKTGVDKETAFRRAWERLTEANPFPATMGRICPHPCEASCSRGDKDGPVAIHALERFLGDWGMRAGLALRRERDAPERESVGVVGGGPAGLSFAYQMARRGYRVTIYEGSPRLGGMLFHGIPEHRLPERILEAEIARILDLGVEARLSTVVGADVSPGELRARHAALFVAIGARTGRRLDVPGEEGPGVFGGIDFLAALNRGDAPDVGARVVVVGGGNTAIDAARAARRLGARVTVMYRRSRREMPALREEVDEAAAEGVEILELAVPIRVVREEGVVTGVEAQRMRPGDADESGRRRPIPIPEAVFAVAADTVLAAVSQEPDWSRLDALRPDGVFVSGEVDREIATGVWAGGDARGPGIAGAAIAQGRAAARAAHRRLRGIEGEPAAESRPRLDPGAVKPEYYPERRPVRPPVTDVQARLADPDREAVGTIHEAQFLSEVSRCFSCGLCFGCQHCWTYCNGFGFTRVAEPAPGTYFAIALERCESCGKCVDLCPCGYLSPGSEARRPI
ncbi:MAG TPA: FAD-dependent oxidoreductase [Candidatus Polarisedimenticolaceae bacterium]